MRKFPPGFHFGAATAAYQIEGSPSADGKGESIWDRFTHAPGTVKGATTGDVACDSYKRWRDDIALLREMNLNSYRFSIAWPRVQPDGRGAFEPRGLDHYARFVEALLEAGIRPLPTLYHWDLPQGLEDAGGWANRDTASRFAEYASVVVTTLGDRVGTWATFNEPWVFTRFGYLDGIHAPGVSDPDLYLRATHTVNLAHALATKAIKAHDAGLRVGCVYSVSPAVPATESDDDRMAAEAFHAYVNLWFATPALHGRYPAQAVAGPLPLVRMGWQDGDEELLRAPLDWAGINYYFHRVVAAAPATAEPLALPFMTVERREFDLTEFGWPVNPDGLRDILLRMYDDLGRVPLEVTENGCSYHHCPDERGFVDDSERIEYLHDHLVALLDASDRGVDVRGYHHWTLIDNFEWAEGFTQRFGLVYLDVRTGERTIKSSGRFFAKIALGNRDFP